ncbi:MAG: GNAT family N-acetyltransferase [Gammaproteobacteria bacterium]|nr:GNAT family N-acetyltransferase [Gammaproteobacteria bacterium]
MASPKELNKENILIRELHEKDIQMIVESFAVIGWNKSYELFNNYLNESTKGIRKIWLAFFQGNFAGYITLSYQSLYIHFKKKDIPEIMDLNVLPCFRKLGIGSLLIHTAEKEAAVLHKTVGLGVGLYTGQDGGYGAAQTLYIKLGYIPDGQGITYDYIECIPGQYYRLDDDLVLWLTKELK